MTGDPKLRDFSWSREAVRSLTVREYQNDPNNPNKARPKPEVLMKGNQFRIFTGAQVTRKRKVTRKGTWIAFREGAKTFFKSLRFRSKEVRNTARKRRDRNAVLNAGQKFDRGVNKLVEDMIKGEVKLDTTSGRAAFKTRTDALYEQAKILKARGPFSDEEIAERFRVNLMESLRVLHAARGKAVHDKVLNDLTKNVLLAFEQFVGSPADDQRDANNPNRRQHDLVTAGLRLGGQGYPEMFRNVQKFNRSVVVAGLRDASTFGSDEKKFKAFGGSRLKHEAFGGDQNAMETFHNDPAAYQRFKGDYQKWDQCYKQWGQCRSLYERFGGSPAELEGDKGAAALRGWLNKTFGKGSGDAFLQKNSRYKDGISGASLKDLGRDLNIDLVPYRSLPYCRLDFKVKNLMGKRNERLRRDFEASLDRGVYDDTPRDSLKWLRDIEDLRGRAKDLDDAQLRKEIRALAKPMKSTGKVGFSKKVGKYDDLNIDGPNCTKFQKLIAEGAGYEFKKGQTKFAQSLDHLEKVDRSGLEKLLGEGFGDIGMSPSPAYDSARIVGTRFDAFTTRCEAAAQERDPNGSNDATIAYYKNVINRRYQKPNGPPIGDQLVEERLTSKQEDNRVLTDQDLRIIEKQLYERGYVRTDTNHDIKEDAGGSELDFLLDKSNPQINKNQEFKSDIGDESPQVGNQKDTVSLLADDEIKTDPDSAEPDRTIRLGKDEMKWDWRFHVTQLNDAEKNDLALGLAKAGRKNVEIGKNQKNDNSCSEDFAKDIENGIVWTDITGSSKSDARRQVHSSADLTQGKSGIRPQDVAFVTGAFSSASIASQFFSDVTFLKDQKNAFNHPESAKLVRYGTDQRYNDVLIQVGKPDGRYLASLTLRAGFDQVRLKDGSTIDADPDSTIAVSIVCNIDCTNGGTVNMIGASFNYQAKAAPSANKIPAPAEPIDEPEASPEPHNDDPNLKIDINPEIQTSPELQAEIPNKTSTNRIVSGLTGGRSFDDVGAKLGGLLDEDDKLLSEQTNNLFSALNYANQLTGVLLPASATSIARHASNILESDIVQNGDDADLKAMLQTLVSNAEKYAQDGVLPE